MMSVLAVGIIILLMLIMVAMGHGQSISHVASVRATLARPVAEVWSRLVDFAAYPQWRRGLARVEVPEPSLQVEIDKRGRKTTYQTVESVANQRLVRKLAEKGPFGGTWTLELEALDGGSTRLTITERGEVYNAFFRFVSRYLIGHHATMVSFVEDLAQALNVSVTIEKA